MMNVAQAWTVVGRLATAFAAMVALAFRAMPHQGKKIVAHHATDAEIDVRNEMTARFESVDASGGVSPPRRCA